MLLREHGIVEYRDGRAFADRLTRVAHRQYPALAESMLDIYREGAGLPRRELHARVERLFEGEPECDPRRVRAFCKLLDDYANYYEDRAGKSARLRLEVFALAAARHPLVSRRDDFFEHEEAEVKEHIARELHRPWPEIERGLYADLIDEQRLRSFDEALDADTLLSEYNVAQVQAALYQAETVTVKAGADLKVIVRAAKLAGLLHEIEAMGPYRYRIVLTGPASALRSTRRYGVNFARFLPSLLACKDWALAARLRTPLGRTVMLELGPGDQLRSRAVPSPQYDSELERKFAEKFGPERDGWTLTREGAILHEGQKVFVPDFVFRHLDGTVVYFEIMGFWTPQYLKRRRETLGRFRHVNMIVAAPRDAAPVLEGLSCRVVLYAGAIRIGEVLKRLEECRSE